MALAVKRGANPRTRNVGIWERDRALESLNPAPTSQPIRHTYHLHNAGNARIATDITADSPSPRGSSLTMPWSLWASPTTNSGKDEGKSPSVTSSTSTTQTTDANTWNSSYGANNMPPPPYHTATERAPADSHLIERIPPIPPQLKKKAISWNDSLWSLIDWQHYQEPRSIVLYTLPTIGAFAVFGIWRKFLRRFRGTAYISPGFFRRRTLLGKVTSVGDGDNFHFFHTPGGRLAGWGWLRKVPTVRKELKDRTVSFSAV